MSRSLYQLPSDYKMHVGQEFFVDGPYDKYGYVVKSEEKTDDATGKKYFLNLVRGTCSERGGFNGLRR